MNFRILLSALLIAATCAHADPARPNTVFVIGEARVEAAPDYVVINIVAGTQGADRNQLSARLQRTVDEIIAVALVAGVKKDDIDASELDRRDEVDEKKVRTTVLERRLRMVNRDLAATPQLVDKLLVLANVNLLNTTFATSGEIKTKERLLVAAAEDARTRGSELATALGRKLGAASSISQEPFEEVRAHMTGIGHLVLNENSPAYAPPARRGSAEYRVPAKLHFSKRVFVIFELQ